jgi:hypothetical protein
MTPIGTNKEAREELKKSNEHQHNEMPLIMEEKLI